MPNMSGTFTATGQSTNFAVMGKFNISLSGTWAGTVRLERSYDNGSTWVVVGSYTSNTETIGEEPETAVLYRFNCTVYTSGTVVYRLGRPD